MAPLSLKEIEMTHVTLGQFQLQMRVMQFSTDFQFEIPSQFRQKEKKSNCIIYKGLHNEVWVVLIGLS